MAAGRHLYSVADRIAKFVFFRQCFIFHDLGIILQIQKKSNMATGRHLEFLNYPQFSFSYI